MPSLRLMSANFGAGRPGAEVCACAYTADGRFALAGDWNGFLHVWEAEGGTHVGGFGASDKPVAVCAASPDGQYWLSGCLDGFLTFWEAGTQNYRLRFLAHNRPLSALVFSPDGRHLATTSWDRNVVLWDLKRDRERHVLGQHADIAAGCLFTPDGHTLVSWSYDRTLVVWDVARGTREATLPGHDDRVTACAVSPDGRWLVTGSRDRSLRLWDFRTRAAACSHACGAEIRACFFLPDGETVAAADDQGRVTLHATPSLQERAELVTEAAVRCAALAPLGGQIALGASDGRLLFVGVEGVEHSPLSVFATPTGARKPGFLDRLLGRRRALPAYACTCPACRKSFELPGANVLPPLPCPHCRRSLRVNTPALN